MPPKAAQPDARTLRAQARARAIAADQAQSGPSAPPRALPTRGRKRQASDASEAPAPKKKVRRGRNAGEDLNIEDPSGHDELDADNVVQPPFLQDPAPPDQPRAVTQGLGNFTWLNEDGLPWAEFDNGITEESKAKFLEDSSYTEYNDDLKKKVVYQWEGKKLLGIGASGVVALWERVQNGTTEKIVLKQSSFVGANKLLTRESGLLDEITTQGAIHVVKILKTIFSKKGKGVLRGGGEVYDKKGASLSRIILEYCDSGDMSSYIKKQYRAYGPDSPIPETIIWKVFECLAKGLLMLEKGIEDPTKAPWKMDPIGHFDIKPENILIQSRTGPEGNHPSYEIFKLTDLGLAKRIPKKPDDETLKQLKQGFGTPNYFPPEMERPNEVKAAPFPDYSTKSNVFQTGQCMYELIMRGRRFSADEYHLVQNNNKKTYGAFGAKVNEVDLYSATLRRLVMQCLAVHAPDRPTPSEILNTCTEVTKILADRTILTKPMKDSIKSDEVEIGPRKTFNSEARSVKVARLAAQGYKAL